MLGGLFHFLQKGVWPLMYRVAATGWAPMEKLFAALVMTGAGLFGAAGVAHAYPQQGDRCKVPEANQIQNGLRCVWLETNDGPWPGGFFWARDRAMPNSSQPRPRDCIGACGTT